jgi:hypothetical protein
MKPQGNHVYTLWNLWSVCVKRQTHYERGSFWDFKNYKTLLDPSACVILNFLLNTSLKHLFVVQRPCIEYFLCTGNGSLSLSSFSQLAWVCGASVRNSDYRSESMGFDPHSGQSKVRLVSLSILTDKIILVVQSRRVPTPPSTGSLVSV